jgi:hypothetical protein
MTKVRGVTGGGIDGKNVAHTNAPKPQQISHNIDPRRPSQIGLSHHYVKGPLYEGRSSTTPQGPTDGMGQGPGSNGRQVMRSGTQGQHGSAVSGTARPGANKPIFPGFK